MASLRVGGGEVLQAVRDGREPVTMTPYRESGYRLLMEALAAEGNLAEALRVYQKLGSRLAEDLGANPAPETQVLHQRLLNVGRGSR